MTHYVCGIGFAHARKYFCRIRRNEEEKEIITFAALCSRKKKLFLFVLCIHADRMRFPFNDCCSGCRSAEEEEKLLSTFSVSACLLLYLNNLYLHRLFSSSLLVSLTDIVSFIKLSGCFSTVA